MMGWSKDGSGLEVKRDRGLTLSQEEASDWNRTPPEVARGWRRGIGGSAHPGRASDVSWFRNKVVRASRQRRRNRRVKRLAKAAIRRADAMLQRILSKYGPGVMVAPPRQLQVIEPSEA